MGSHSVTCHPAEVTLPSLPQPKLVLDLATPKGSYTGIKTDMRTDYTNLSSMHDKKTYVSGNPEPGPYHTAASV